jgi:hypothetical protein
MGVSAKEEAVKPVTDFSLQVDVATRTRTILSTSCTTTYNSHMETVTYLVNKDLFIYLEL